MAHAAKMCALLELLQRRLQEGLDRVRSLEKKDLLNHLLQISRAIDHAVASSQRPSAPQKVLDIFKMITKLKDDDTIKPSMMVFLLAVKGACRAGWFSLPEAEELLSLYDQLLLYFQLDGDCSRQLTTTGSILEENSDAVALITSVCQRYSPRIKLVSVILSLTTKKEYETRGCDFIVTPLAPRTKLFAGIRGQTDGELMVISGLMPESLFVIQMENTETSACLVSPHSLSLILNGRGVERRSSLQNSPDTGPQMPSDVMHLLRLGNNFIQVVGESPGKYMVAIATISINRYTSATVQLTEYIAPSTEGDNIDDEVVEAGSRVSLRCPISHKRIITPVKGLLCRHHQCFDFDSYIDMNELRPVWRCPCCNSSVSCVQLRLDKKMKQILEDVEEKCFEAIINQDGSWIPGRSCDEQKESIARCTAGAGGVELNQLTGADVTKSGDGVIELSDDDDISEPAASAEKVMSPRGPPVRMKAPSSSEGQKDRKPDIRDTSGSNPVQSSGLFGASTRERLNTSAGYSPMNDASGQTGLPSNQHRGVPESNTAVRHVQNPAPNTHLWSGGNVSLHASLLSAAQQPVSRVSSLDRNAYTPTGGQSLAGANHAFAQRPRVGTAPQSVISGAAADGGFITTSQLHSGHLAPVQLGSEQVFQHDIQHQQQSQDLLRQMQLSSSSFRAPVEMDASQRSQRWGVQQGTVINEQSLARQAHVQQFGSASPTLMEQPAHNQTYSLSGYINPLVQGYWQSQRAVQAQQAVLDNSNHRMGGGRAPTVSGVPFVSPTTAAAGAQQGPTPRMNPRVTNTGDGNMSTTFVATSSNTSGPSTQQVLNWRPTGRMRGSVSGGYLPGNRVGVNSVAPQPGPVNRGRVPAVPSTASSPISNSMEMVSPISPNSSPATVQGPSVPSTEGVRVSVYNASRLAADELSGADAFLNSGAPINCGETLHDMIWLPTLGSDQVDNVGAQAVDRWLDEALFTNASSEGL